jgi:monothiol glutaredoxin
MSLDSATRERIASLVASDRVVLFMKGTRDAPQCGFSRTVVGVLDRLVPEYRTVDVLADPEIREGVKVFSSWPTVPQLYVDEQFVGGCDIVTEMFASGELQQLLGVAVPAKASPRITVTEKAAAALKRLGAGEDEERTLHLSVDARFQNGLWFGPPEEGDVRSESAGIVLHLDLLSASRADGLVLDAEEGPGGPSFRIDNPNCIDDPNAPRVRAMTVQELKRRLDAGEGVRLLDVRTPDEAARARIEGARLVDESVVRELEALDRRTPLVFHCHHGGRSQAAAEHFAKLGFSEVYSVEGGIDAWSREIDPRVPRY